MLNELSTFCGNIILTKDVGNDDNNFLFKKNFNSYDFKKREPKGRQRWKTRKGATHFGSQTAEKKDEKVLACCS